MLQVLEEMKVKAGDELPLQAALMDGGTEIRFQILKSQVTSPPCENFCAPLNIHDDSVYCAVMMNAVQRCHQ